MSTKASQGDPFFIFIFFFETVSEAHFCISLLRLIWVIMWCQQMRDIGRHFSRYSYIV